MKWLTPIGFAIVVLCEMALQNYRVLFFMSIWSFIGLMYGYNIGSGKWKEM